MSDTIQFTCPQCSHAMQLPVAVVGKKGTCPSCQATVTVTNEPMVDLASLEEQSPVHPLQPPPISGKTSLSVHQLDTTTFLVENSNRSEVFARISNAAKIGHTVNGAFERSGIIRGSGRTGMTFVINISECDEGVTIDVDGDTPSGSEFGALFDPTSIEGWGLFAATELFNATVNTNSAEGIQNDVLRLLFHLLNSLDATHILGLNIDEIETITGVSSTALRESKKGTGTLVVYRPSAFAGRGLNVKVWIDGEVVGKLKNGETKMFPLGEGEHLLEVKHGFKKLSKKVLIKAGVHTSTECHWQGSVWALDIK